jgi:hypothetical protein
MKVRSLETEAETIIVNRRTAFNQAAKELKRENKQSKPTNCDIRNL